jgi:hypothetical protein
MAIAHEKKKVIGDYFMDHLASIVSRPASLIRQALGYSPHDLSELEALFTYEEVKDTVNSMLSDKVPSPDGFTSARHVVIIKDDVMAVLNSLFSMNSHGFEMLNSANIVLLPRKMEALRVMDYRPVSLIHSIVIIFSKLLANRLGLQLLERFHKKEKHPRQLPLCPRHSAQTTQIQNVISIHET